MKLALSKDSSRYLYVRDAISYIGITELQQLVEINLHLQKTRVTDQEIDILGIQIVRLQQLQKLHLNLQVQIA